MVDLKKYLKITRHKNFYCTLDIVGKTPSLINAENINKERFNIEYHLRRTQRKDLIHRINKRIKIISKEIDKNFKNNSNLKILDIGCADGIILSRLNKQYNFKKADGIDLSQKLIELNKDKKINLFLYDVEKKLPFKTNTYDIILNIATIQNIKNKQNLICEIQRILRKNGIFIMTEANPLYWQIGNKLGYFKDDMNEDEYCITMQDMRNLCINSNLKIIEEKYFGLNPLFRIPLEELFEDIINKIGMGKLISNQIIVAMKDDDMITI